jgi:hypothetical protein
MSEPDKVVYSAVPRPKTITVAALMRQLSKFDESLEVMVDTEARCDQYHMYPVEGVWEVKEEEGVGKFVYISLHI